LKYYSRYIEQERENNFGLTDDQEEIANCFCYKQQKAFKITYNLFSYNNYLPWPNWLCIAKADYHQHIDLSSLLLGPNFSAALTRHRAVATSTPSSAAMAETRCSPWQSQEHLQCVVVVCSGAGIIVDDDAGGGMVVGGGVAIPGWKPFTRLLSRIKEVASAES